MAKTFHDRISGSFHVKKRRLYRIVKVNRDTRGIVIGREVISEFFKGNDFLKYKDLLPTQWESGVAHELQRIRYIAGTHTPLEV
ncbi:hypothetical protein K9M48_03830 [Candidatus Gracilibacteria bacterium]|nr:hypothetical protein [Candidatus Gracilibacteria bacterium]